MRIVCFSILLSILAACPAAALACRKESFVIAIDAGHSKLQPGATSARGIPEVMFNERLAQRLQRALADAGFRDIFFVAPGAKSHSLIERAARANRRKARILLSIHHDSVQPEYLSIWRYDGKNRRYSDTFTGYSLFVSTKNRDSRGSRQLAEQIGEQLRRIGSVPSLHHSESIAGEHRELLDARRGIYAFDELVLLKKADMAAVLLEAGIIVNRRDEIQLTNSRYQAEFAGAVAMAVERYCALSGY
jgi:N-acetylmuramoyl-L-alanine amidase